MSLPKFGGGRMGNPNQLIRNQDGSYSRVGDLENGQQLIGGGKGGAKYAQGEWKFRTPGDDPQFERGNWIENEEGKPERVLDVDPPDGYWEYERDEYEQRQYEMSEFKCPNLKDDPEEFKWWYKRLRWIHFIIAAIQLTIFGMIVGYAANNKLTGRVRSTTDFLEANPMAPPALASVEQTFHEPHLYWLFFIPLVCGLFHLILGWPHQLVGEIMPRMSPSEAKRIGGERDGYGELRAYKNRFYDKWFYNNVVHELAGIKHFPYAFCYAMLVTGISFTVGVTNVFLNISLFMLAFVSSLGLWYMEYGNGYALKSYYQQKSKIAADPSLNEAAQLLNQNDEAPPELRERREGLLEIITDLVARPVIMWIPYMIALVSETLIFVVLWAYFGKMIAHNAGSIHWYVYFAMLWYTAIKVFEFMTILFFWLDFYIFKCYIWMETTHLIMHAATFGAITTAIVFGSMDQGVLYG